MKIQGVSYPSDFEAKKAITETGRRMEQKSFAVAGDGSLSVRVGPNAVWITIADVDKGAIAYDSMIRVDLNGRVGFNGREKELPEEVRWHLRVYQENPEVRGIIHGFPPVINTYAVRGIPLAAAAYTKAVRKLGGVPVISGGEAQSAILDTKSACGVIFAGNGCMTWGGSLGEAWQRMQAMEYSATVGEHLRMCGMQEASGQAGGISACGGYRPCGEGRQAVCAGEGTAQSVAAENSRAVADTASLKGVTPLVRPGDRPVSVLRGAEPAQALSGREQTTGMTQPTPVKQDSPAICIRQHMMNEVVRRTFGL